MPSSNTAVVSQPSLKEVTELLLGAGLNGDQFKAAMEMVSKLGTAKTTEDYFNVTKMILEPVGSEEVMKTYGKVLSHSTSMENLKEVMYHLCGSGRISSKTMANVILMILVYGRHKLESGASPTELAQSIAGWIAKMVLKIGNRSMDPWDMIDKETQRSIKGSLSRTFHWFFSEDRENLWEEDHIAEIYQFWYAFVRAIASEYSESELPKNYSLLLVELHEQIFRGYFHSLLIHEKARAILDFVGEE